jgi:hypothetical protein
MGRHLPGCLCGSSHFLAQMTGRLRHRDARRCRRKISGLKRVSLRPAIADELPAACPRGSGRRVTGLNRRDAVACVDFWPYCAPAPPPPAREGSRSALGDPAGLSFVSRVSETAIAPSGRRRNAPGPRHWHRTPGTCGHRCPELSDWLQSPLSATAPVGQAQRRL